MIELLLITSQTGLALISIEVIMGLVVTYEDFFAILKKYNLYCGPISTFSGFIPSENVSQIAKASNALNSLNLNYVSWVEAVRIDSRMSKDMTKRLVEYFSRFPFVFKGIDRGYQYMRSIGGSYKEEDYLHINTDKHVIHHLNVSRCRNDYRAISV